MHRRGDDQGHAQDIIPDFDGSAADAAELLWELVLWLLSVLLYPPAPPALLPLLTAVAAPAPPPPPLLASLCFDAEAGHDKLGAAANDDG